MLNECYFFASSITLIGSTETHGRDCQNLQDTLDVDYLVNAKL